MNTRTSIFVFLLVLLQITSLHAQQTYRWIAGSGSWNTSDYWDPKGIPGPSDNVEIPVGASVTVSGTTTVNGLHQSGDIVVMEALFIRENYSWASGKIDGPGVLATELLCQASIAGTQFKQLGSQTTFRNNGLLTWSTSYLHNQNGATFVNNGSIDFNATASGTKYTFRNTTFENNGFINKSTGGDTRIMANFRNNGLITVSMGNLVIIGQSEVIQDIGTYIIEKPGELQIDGLERVFSDQSSVTGDGNVCYKGNMVRIQGEYKVDSTILDYGNASFETGKTLELAHLRMISGNLHGGDTLRFNQSITLEGGAIRDTIVAVGETSAVLEINIPDSFSLTDRAGLYNYGIGSWIRGTMANWNDASFRNHGLINILGKARLEGGTFLNEPGAILTVTSDVDVDLEGHIVNNGSMNVTAGNMRLAQGNIEAIHTGNMHVGPQAELFFGNGRNWFSEGSSLESAGGWIVFGDIGHTTIEGRFSADSVQVENQYVRFTGNVEIPYLNHLGGSIASTDTTRITEYMYWGGEADLRGKGIFLIDTGAVADIFDDTKNISDTLELLNEGEISWYSGNMQFSQQSLFTNLGELNIRGPVTFNGGKVLNAGGGHLLFNHAGTSQFTTHDRLENEGIVTIKDGNVDWGSATGFQVDSGWYGIDEQAVLNLLPGDRVFHHKMVMQGTGTIVAPEEALLYNMAIYLPGNPIGTLYYQGPFYPGDSATFVMEIAGTNPGISYDQMEIDGIAVLGGRLEIEFSDGYLPEKGDAFELFLADSVSGAFREIYVPEVYTYRAEYRDDRFVLIITEAEQPVFEETGILMEAVSGSVAQWADRDMDGDQDIVYAGELSGTNESLLFHYENEFENMQLYTFLQDSRATFVKWVDIDNDNDADLLVSDSAATELNSYILINSNGNLGSEFLPLPGMIIEEGAFNDFDHDGDADLLYAGSDPATKQKQTGILLNLGDGKFEIMENSPFFGLDVGRVNWVDFDANGETDVFICGTGTSGENYAHVFRNNGHGTDPSEYQFSQALVPFPEITNSAYRWGDLNGDGLPDLAIAGLQNSLNVINRIYINQGNGIFRDLADEQDPDLISLFAGEIRWFDFDSDGDLDLLHIGFSSDDAPVVPVLYKNENGNLSRTYTGLDSIVGTICIADFDNDNDPDLFLSGSDLDGGIKTKLYRNIIDHPNHAPMQPTGLQSTTGEKSVLLQWEAATDPETATPLLSYNVRIGTRPGGSDVLSPLSDVSGDLYMPRQGNAGQRLELELKGLEKGKTYYWSVQAVDPSYQGSKFAPEESFFIPNPTDVIERVQSALIQVFPNPARDELHLIIPETNGPVIVRLFNTAGITVNTFHSEESELDLDFSGYPTGIYYIAIESAQGYTGQTIIKK